MTSYSVLQAGPSTSFPQSHALLANASSEGAGLVIAGADAGAAYEAQPTPGNFHFVAIELGNECLSVHVGEQLAAPPCNVVGFARFRLGNAEPTQLVEIVTQPNTTAAALAAARAVFEAAGLKVAVCSDVPGRIVNRLIRPVYNALLRRLDERLASAADLDKTLCLGLGYPQGLLALLEHTGLDHHCEATTSLYHALGDPAYLPARRAQVAYARTHRKR